MIRNIPKLPCLDFECVADKRTNQASSPLNVVTIGVQLAAVVTSVCLSPALSTFGSRRFSISHDIFVAKIIFTKVDVMPFETGGASKNVEILARFAAVRILSRFYEHWIIVVRYIPTRSTWHHHETGDQGLFD